MISKINILNYPIFSGKLSEIKIEKQVINTINPHSYCVAKKDKVFNYALKSSDILLPDGIGIVWAAKTLNNIKINRITGYDVFEYLMSELNKTKGKCFFLGSTNDTLLKIQHKVGIEYPNVKVKTFSPPFKEVFSENDNSIMIDEINSFSPDILFVGMTAPKQEKWVYHHKDFLNSKSLVSIGAVFNFYSGNEKRANPLFVKLGLEWLYRSVQNPFRLGKRNILAIPKFLLYVLIEKLKIK